MLAPGEAVTGAVPGGNLRIGPVRAPQQRLQQSGCALIMEWISEQPGQEEVVQSGQEILS